MYRWPIERSAFGTGLLLFFLVFLGMALFADFAVIGGFDAALVVALFSGFHGGIATRLLVISGLDRRDAEKGKRANCKGQ